MLLMQGVAARNFLMHFAQSSLPVFEVINVYWKHGRRTHAGTVWVGETDLFDRLLVRRCDESQPQWRNALSLSFAD